MKSQRDHTVTSPTVRIMTYNVHRCVGLDGKLNLKRTAEVIAACDPDIVALQELDVLRKRTGDVDQAHLLAEILGMTFHFHPALTVEEEKYGDAILTNLPERLVKAGPLPGSRALEPRGALWIAVDISGIELQVINTHLGLSPHERLMQVRSLIGDDWLGHEDCHDPVLLVGDFNAVRLSRAYRVITSRLRDCQTVTTDRPKRTYPSRMPLLRIDHVFCSDRIEVLGARTASSSVARAASDHLPLLVDFRLVSAPLKESPNLLRRQGLHASAAPSGSPK